MMDQLNAARRDEVLFAFHRECPTPTVQQIADWVERYPSLADDIREHAALRLDWAAQREGDEDQVEELLLTRGRSRALNAIFKAQRAAQAQADNADAATFDQLMSQAGKNVPQLAREIDIGRDVLSDLINGRMLAPVGRRLVDAFVQAVGSTVEAFHAAFDHACANPRMGMAKASGQPTVVAQSYETIIRRSSMGEDRRAFWLEDA